MTNAINPQGMQGDMTLEGNRQTWQSYYYFNATGSVRVELPWYIEDVSTNEWHELFAPGTTPESYGLVDWLSTPAPGAPGAVDDTAGGVILQWSLGLDSRDGSYSIECDTGLGWQEIGTVLATTATAATDVLTFTHEPGRYPPQIQYRLRYLYGGQASDYSPVTTFVWLDSDGDGLPDDWERAWGLDATNAADASWTLFGDGRTAWEAFDGGSAAAATPPSGSGTPQFLGPIVNPVTPRVMCRRVWATATNPGFAPLDGSASYTRYLKAVSTSDYKIKAGDDVTYLEHYENADTFTAPGRSGDPAVPDHDKHSLRSVTQPQDPNDTGDWKEVTSKSYVPIMKIGSDLFSSYSIHESSPGYDGTIAVSLDPAKRWSTDPGLSFGSPGTHEGEWDGTSELHQWGDDFDDDTTTVEAADGDWDGTSELHQWGDDFDDDTTTVEAADGDWDGFEISEHTGHPDASIEWFTDPFAGANDQAAATYSNALPPEIPDEAISASDHADTEFSYDYTEYATLNLPGGPTDYSYNYSGSTTLSLPYAFDALMADVAGAIPAQLDDPGWEFAYNITGEGIGIDGGKYYGPIYPNDGDIKRYNIAWVHADEDGQYCDVADAEYWFETDDAANTLPVTWLECFAPENGDAIQVLGIHTWDPRTGPVCPKNAFQLSSLLQVQTMHP